MAKHVSSQWATDNTRWGYKIQRNWINLANTRKHTQSTTSLLVEKLTKLPFDFVACGVILHLLHPPIFIFLHVIRFFHAITRWFINNCFDRIAATSRIMHNIIFRTHYCGNIFLYYYFCFSAFSFADCRRGLDDVMVSLYKYQIKTKDFWRGFFFYVRLRYKSHVEIIHGYIAWNMTNVQQQKRVYAIYP